jgi:hypothetical protein
MQALQLSMQTKVVGKASFDSGLATETLNLTSNLTLGFQAFPQNSNLRLRSSNGTTLGNPSVERTSSIVNS